MFFYSSSVSALSSKGLSSSSKQTLDNVQSWQPTQNDEVTILDEGNWADIDDGEPMDDDMEVSGEDDEIHILLEMSGV